MRLLILLTLISAAISFSQERFNGAKLHQDSTKNGITFYSDSAKNVYIKATFKSGGEFGIVDQAGNLYFSIPGDLLSQDNLNYLLYLRQKWQAEKGLSDLEKKKK